jgi:hypothetical protein
MMALMAQRFTSRTILETSQLSMPASHTRRAYRHRSVMLAGPFAPAERRATDCRYRGGGCYPFAVMRVLLSEGSSLTAREFVTALGPRGHQIGVLDPDRFCLARWSRWVRRVHQCPPAGRDPSGYLDVVRRLLDNDQYDVLLPTHEQAWLFSVARERLGSRVGLAVAAPSAFARVESKIEFARLLDQVGLRQPAWSIVQEKATLWTYPCYLKAPFSTAGRGVRLIRSDAERSRALAQLGRTSSELMMQESVSGVYCQVQALFDRGKLIASHTSQQLVTGMGGSAAARLSVDHESPRLDVEKLGAYLNWHGGITLDYIFDGTPPTYIECNPRTVEPGNAAASGVDIPELQVRLSAGLPITPSPVGRSGVRTHGLIAVLFGAASGNRRRSIFAQMMRVALARGEFTGSTEQLTPALRDH